MASFLAKPATRAGTSLCSSSVPRRRNSLSQTFINQTAGFKSTIPAATAAAAAIHSPQMYPPASAPPSRFPNRGPDPAFQPMPFPNPPDSYPTPHPNVSVDLIKPAHIQPLMRVSGLLLPVRYPNSFYTSTISDPVISSLSRVAVYHDYPLSEATPTITTPPSVPFSESSSLPSSEKVIGGIRCRLEPVSSAPTSDLRPPTNLYIQTLHLLSQYRGSGIAASLLNSLIYDEAKASDKSNKSVSPLVKHYNIRSVTAHVQETNIEALMWYAARGFAIQDGIVEGYYRRLNCGNARIVKLDLNWEEPNAFTLLADNPWQGVQNNASSTEHFDDRGRDNMDKIVGKRLKKQ